MKIGLSTLLFGGYDRDVAVQEAHRAGYDGLELCAIPRMGDHVHPGMCDCVYDGIRYTLEKSGLVLDAVGCSGGGPGTARFEGLMETAAKVGAPYCTTGSGGLAEDEDAWKVLMGQMSAAVAVCERTQVKLSIKPHVRASVYNIDSARRFVEELDSEWIGLNIDNTHLQRSGDDPVRAVKELKDWIFTARIRDFKSDDLGIGPVENQIPGKGQADVRGYWDALAEHTKLDIVSVEMVGAKEFELDEVVRVITETIGALRAY